MLRNRPTPRSKPEVWILTTSLVGLVLGGCAGPGRGATGGRLPMTVALLEGGGSGSGVEVSGPGVDRDTTVRLYPEHADPDDPSFPPARGRTTYRQGRLRFEPRYPLEPGARFQVVVSRRPASRGELHWVEVPPAEPGVATRVLAIHPTSDELPANQLKLYVEFSGPMSTSAPYDHLRLVDDATGEPVEAVFHQMRRGLWDPRGTRWTVLFDPGRIKRGLANHRAMGLPLAEGRAYRLEISAEWPDADGRPLAAGFVKRFVAGPPDRTSPSPSDWTLTTPPAGGVEPLAIDFGEPLDAALLARAFEVLDANGRVVATDAHLGADERSVQLRPREPWRGGSYRLEIDPTLEDLAGNNLRRPFDVDLDAGVISSPQTWLAFELGPPNRRSAGRTPRRRPRSVEGDLP